MIDPQRIFNEPALIAASDANYLKLVVAGEVTIKPQPDPYLDGLLAVANTDTVMGLNFGFREGQDRPYPINAEGYAVITIHGVMVNRSAWWGGYYTGYDSVIMRLQIAQQDPDVRGILLDVNTGGGEAAGCFELAAFIREVAEDKPTLAFVNSRSLSAGYAIASGAQQIYAQPSASIGSIGVLITHWNYAKWLEKIGDEVTFVYAGAHKVDGNPYQPLPDEVREKFQASVDATYEDFVTLVAAHRSIDAQAVRDTEADIFDTAQAEALGLIDGVVSVTDLPALLAERVTTVTTKPNERTTMSDEEQGAAKATQIENQVRADAAAAAKVRIKGIMQCEEAKGREAMAEHLAYETDMKVEEAKALLAVAPQQAAETETANGDGSDGDAGAAFAAAMQKGNPEIEADDTDGEGAEGETGCTVFATYDKFHKRQAGTA